MTLFSALMPSPLGRILLQANQTGLTALYFEGQKDFPLVDGGPNERRARFDPRAGDINGVQIHRMRILGERGVNGNLFASRPDMVQSPAGAEQPLEFMQTQLPDSSRQLLLQARNEVIEYFSGERREFSVPLAPAGTVFQKRVWDALYAIPYGETVSYGQLGLRCGYAEGHARAIGMAVGRNPISIIIPCHRIVASGRSLNGYSGGLDRKLSLLQLEGFELG